MITEEYIGNSCTGSSGDKNRVLTLGNTSKTVENGLRIWVDGLLLYDDDFNIAHNDSGSEITFLNKLWDDMDIRVDYNISAIGPEGDVIKIINEVGGTITRTPVTIEIDNTTGQRKRIEGTSEDIGVLFVNTQPQYTLNKSGLSEGADAKMFVKKGQNINKWDKIERGNQVYWVESSGLRKYAGEEIFKTVLLKKVEAE